MLITTPGPPDFPAWCVSVDLPSRSDAITSSIFKSCVSPSSAALLIVAWFLIQLVNAGALAYVQTGGVGYLAHVGGCIFGAVTARWFENPQRVAEQRRSQ